MFPLEPDRTEKADFAARSSANFGLDMPGPVQMYVREAGKNLTYLRFFVRHLLSESVQEPNKSRQSARIALSFPLTNLETLSLIRVTGVQNPFLT